MWSRRAFGSSVAVTVQTPDGYDFSTLYNDMAASNLHQSANNATHIFAVGAGKTFDASEDSLDEPAAPSHAIH